MLKDLIQPEIQKLVSIAKRQINNSNTVALKEAWKILNDNSADVVIFLQTFGESLSSPEKKEQAMLIMSNFYDQVFTVVQFPFVPQILQPLVQKTVKAILIDILISSAIDSTVTTLRKVGVIQKKNPSTIVATNADTVFIPSEDVSPKISDK
jgi:hypothetical protein